MFAISFHCCVLLLSGVIRGTLSVCNLLSCIASNIYYRVFHCLSAHPTTSAFHAHTFIRRCFVRGEGVCLICFVGAFPSVICYRALCPCLLSFSYCLVVCWSVICLFFQVLLHCYLWLLFSPSYSCGCWFPCFGSVVLFIVDGARPAKSVWCFLHNIVCYYLCTLLFWSFLSIVLVRHASPTVRSRVDLFVEWYRVVPRPSLRRLFCL